MKKMTLKMRLLGGLVIVSMLFAASCAQGVDDETFTAGVTNAQLESPAAESMSYALVADASGTELMKISWPVVVGAGGYLCNVWNVNEPENPVQVVENEVVDGASILFAFVEDSDYLISVQTLGNKALNNAGADTATEKKFSAKTPGITIPAGTPDVGAFINNYMTEHADELAEARKADSNFEIAFDLEPGQTYEMATVADFGVQPTRVRGDRAERPILILKDNACFVTAGGLRMKFLNIDASGLDKQDHGLIMMSQDPGIEKGANSCYHCIKPVRIESCWVKQLKRSLFTYGTTSWALTEFRMNDCIIQLNHANNGGHKTFLYPYDPSMKGSIFNIYLSNSTMYNIYDPASMGDAAYFIRFGGQKAFSATFGSTNGVLNIQNCTLNRLNPKKDFGNRVGYEGTCTFTDNIFYDSALVQKVLGRGCTPVTSNNIMLCPLRGGVDNTDKEKYVSEQDPGFTEENLIKELDFSKPNGGVDFTPTAGITAGDPRWL